MRDQISDFGYELETERAFGNKSETKSISKTKSLKKKPYDVKAK